MILAIFEKNPDLFPKNGFLNICSLYLGPPFHIAGEQPRSLPGEVRGLEAAALGDDPPVEHRAVHPRR